MLVSNETIGNNLRKARKQAALTQAALAEQLGCTPLHMGRMERGERPASLENLAKMARTLNVPLSALLSGCVDDGSRFDAPSQSAEELAESVKRIADGCSAQLCRMMTDVCRTMARAEKQL